MNRFKKSVVAAAGIVLLTLIMTISDGGQVMAQAVRPLLVEIINTEDSPVPVTHVVSGAERVQLQLTRSHDDVCGAGGHAVRRILPDGTSVSPFTVPPGKLLVLTDLQGVVIEREFPWAAGKAVLLTASIGTGSNAGRLNARAQVNADAVASGMMAVSVQSQSGVLGGSNAAVCVAAGLLVPQGTGSAAVDRAELQGYLIAE